MLKLFVYLLDMVLMVGVGLGFVKVTWLMNLWDIWDMGDIWVGRMVVGFFGVGLCMC